MRDPKDGGASRRGFLAAALGVAGAAGAGGGAAADPSRGPAPGPRGPAFYGRHQAGITAPIQRHAYFAALDVTAEDRASLLTLFTRWTEAGAVLADGRPLPDPASDLLAVPADTGETVGLAHSAVLLTFGFGPGLFLKAGVDRFGLARHRPEALADLPRFVGDQLVPERTGGDLCILAEGDDPQATFHAVRQLARLADGVARIRWVQAGFTPGYDPRVTPRNLMGFKDGTMNPAPEDRAAMDRHVWVGEEGGAWMRGGSYLVVRPIRIALEHWDRMKLGFQEQTVGRRKASGAPLGADREDAPLPLSATNADGEFVIPENAHVRLAAPETNDGAQILRRSYSYDNGVGFVAERWPPWRQGMEFDAGLLFMCYQRDPRTGFSKLFDKMAKFDMMNQFVTHVGGGVFACPPGAEPGRPIAEALMAAA